jgi:hypothetical protein
VPATATPVIPQLREATVAQVREATVAPVRPPTAEPVTTHNVAQPGAVVAPQTVVEYTIATPKPRPNQQKQAKRVQRAARATVSGTALLPANVQEMRALDPKALARRYGAIGRALARLDGSMGRENTEDLWAAFHMVPITEAMASPEAREQAATTLATIQEAIDDRSR